MPRKPLKIRRAMLVVTLAMLAVVLVAWGMSHWRETYLSYWRSSNPSVVAGDQPSDGKRVEVGCTSLMSMYGSVVLVNHDGAFPYLRTDSETWRSPFPGWSGALLPASGPVRGSIIFQYDGQRPDLSMAGIEWRHVSGQDLSSYAIALPHGLLAILFAGSAFWLWFPPHRTAKRLANQQCPRCGYDRKGLAPAAACPECGETPAPAPPAA